MYSTICEFTFELQSDILLSEEAAFECVMYDQSRTSVDLIACSRHTVACSLQTMTHSISSFCTRSLYQSSKPWCGVSSQAICGLRIALEVTNQHRWWRNKVSRAWIEYVYVCVHRTTDQVILAIFEALAIRGKGGVAQK